MNAFAFGPGATNRSSVTGKNRSIVHWLRNCIVQLPSFFLGALCFLFGPNAAFGQGCIWPLYMHPSDPSWQQAEFCGRYLASDGLNGFNMLICIVNPNSGPGTVRDQAYLAGIRRLRAAGSIVIGYQSTGYGKRTYREIKAEIDRWIAFYGNDIQGLLLDEWAGQNASSANLYRDLYWLVRTFHGKPLCVANPGVSFASNAANPEAAWWADIFIIHEQTFANSANYTVPAWINTPARANEAAVLIHAMPAGQQVTTTTTIQPAKSRGMKWIYVTDDLLPNPWYTLPGVQSGFKSGQWNPYFGNVVWSIGRTQ